MKRFYLYPICLLTFFILNANFVQADVLGPYRADSVPATPAGYGRIVLLIFDANAPVTASITVSDESGQQYTLTTREPDSPPNFYFMATGTYSVVSLEHCQIRASGWGSLTIGSTFYVDRESSSYISLEYTGPIPDRQSIIRAPSGSDNEPAPKPYYATMKVYGIDANGGGTLVDEKRREYTIFNYTGHIGGAYYFYILPGTYTVKKIETSGNYIYLEINGTKSLLSDGMTFTVASASTDISIVFSKDLL